MTMIYAKPPHNWAENRFYDYAIAEGWTPMKRGWPDFFLERDGEIICVEVKPDKKYKLKPHQEKIMKALSSYGIPCFKWTPNGGLERVKP